jgi:WD40 repeat protein
MKKQHSLSVRTLAFASNGDQFLSGGMDGLVIAHSLSNVKSHHVMRGHQHQLHSIDVSHDDTLVLSAGVDCSIRLWLFLTYECLRVIAATTPICSARFLGRTTSFATCSNEGVLTTWSHDGVITKSIIAHEGSINCLTSTRFGNTGPFQA